MIGYVISKQEKNFFKKIFNKLDIAEYENGKKYIIPKLNQKVIEKLKKDNIEGESEANKTHYNIGKNIREVIAKNGGTMPEDLPAPDKSLKELEKETKNILINSK